MGNRECYIKSVSYMSEGIPDVKGLVAPGEARRMGRLLKRAVATSFAALRQSGIEVPEAIVTGTWMGCMDHSEKFLVDICTYGEEGLKPTLFMQSTHNTISSLIAILLKCHGYNNTYSQGGLSFESALLDARLQICSGEADTVLAGSHDEVTPLMASIMHLTHPDGIRPSDDSIATLLTSDSEGAIAGLSEVKIMRRPSPEVLREEIGDAHLVDIPSDRETFPSTAAAFAFAVEGIRKGLFNDTAVLNHDGNAYSILKLKSL